MTTLTAARPAHLPDPSPAVPALVSITINGRVVQVAEGTSVAAAMLAAGEACRLSVRGEPRSPLCGMGICMECRATVNGIPHRLTCQMLCAAGMQVVTE
ncbi:MAG: 2Fe-2S iron-sulfur cluster-binding protein [Terracidiphilus sp.]